MKYEGCIPSLNMESVAWLNEGELWARFVVKAEEKWSHAKFSTLKSSPSSLVDG
jgi:hypothetical protein